MQNKHESILRKINKTDKQYSILTAATHESYQSNLGGLPHTFYLYQKDGFVKWKENHRPLPNNHILLDGSEQQIKPDMKFDIVIGQQIFNQMQCFKPIAEQMGLPLIRLEHTTCEGMPYKQIEGLKQLRGNINVFISEYSVGAWHFDIKDPTVRIIRHGINCNVFKPLKNPFNNGSLLHINNDLINRGYILGFDILQRITQGLSLRIIGDTPGLSRPSNNREELINEMQSCSAYVNTTRLSPVPTSLIEAMACGRPVVSTATCAIPEFLKDGYNGFVSNDEAYLRDRLKWILKNPEKAQELGDNARKTVLEFFSLEKHLESWSKVLDEAFGSIYE